MCDILFVLKKRNNHQEWPESYTDQNGYFSSGLYNSVKFLVDALSPSKSIEMVEVADNNGIDRQVTLHKPKVVIIEALWVVPEKFDILAKLHPNVKWVIRIHSEIPFLANEGVALRWLSKYVKTKNVYVAANSVHAKKSLQHLFGTHILYLPNYYPIGDVRRKVICDLKPTINISCFGAIRPMKNHLQQAMAAMKFADENDLKLRFHVNAVRLEQRGDAVLHNLRAMFESNETHSLVECMWMPHDKFKQYINRHIDIGMQVSFSETFNIVTADHITCGIPVVTSKEVEFVFPYYQAEPTNEADIVKKLNRAYRSKLHSLLNIFLLKSSNTETEYEWDKYMFGLGVR